MKAFLLAALILCLFVVAAPGAVTKIVSFTPAGSLGPAENPRVDGMATINIDSHTRGSNVHLHVEGLVPNQAYGVAIYQTGSDYGQADFVDPLGLIAGPAGNGTFDASMPATDLGPHPLIQVFLWDGDCGGDSMMIITQDELRAVGIVP
jgi:hypothetical protein